jgi:hypothetical protein|tara:strand:+ start:649 stop:861 length:213 start_codon:yes stop_codon:yes gene_type:complete
MRFRNTSEVYKFLDCPTDVWCLPIVESYVDDIGLEEREDFDVKELNEWLASELAVISREYEEYTDSLDYA